MECSERPRWPPRSPPAQGTGRAQDRASVPIRSWGALGSQRARRVVSPASRCRYGLGAGTLSSPPAPTAAEAASPVCPLPRPKAAVVPSAQTLRITDFSFSDFELSDLETALCTIRMFTDLNLVQNFQMKHEVGSGIPGEGTVCACVHVYMHSCMCACMCARGYLHS